MRLIYVATAIGALASPASAMPVSTFLAKADALKSRGPLAFFSSDLKLLTNQVKGDFAHLRAERLAAQASHGRPAFCLPASGGIKLSDEDIMGAMQAVPAPQRAQTDTRDALRAYMARRFPCRA